jgi:hypothetical protein
MVQKSAPLLIMTATIVPPADAANLSRTDPSLRLRDYAGALEFYVGCLERGVISGIVFAENSQADISALKTQVASSPKHAQIEFIQFPGLDHPGSNGRGFGEFKLLDFAMAHSELIRTAPADAEVWKVTGRYKVLNLSRILSRRRPAASLWVHCRNRPRRWADMYLLGWRRDYYSRHVQGLYRELDETGQRRSAEVMFRDKVDTLAQARDVCLRLNPSPELSGVRGLDGRAYADQRAKQILRRVCDRFLPWVWI